MTTRTTYPSYKPSGIEWLGDIPSHWETRRAKFVLAPIDVRSKDGQEELLTVSESDGVVPRASKSVTMFQAENYTGYKLCWPGDLVINSLWAWHGGLGVSNHHGIISSAYGVYRDKSGQIEPRYLNYKLRSEAYKWEFQVRSKGIWISRLQLTDESFLGIPLILPPLDEQRAIADYLDRKDAEITRFIESRRRMIALLEEKKQAIINQAVTRGLDPSVPMKDSGVEWLGEIPAHWEDSRIRDVIVDSVAGIWGDEATGDSSTDTWCIRVADFEMRTLGVSKHKQTYRNVPAAALTKRLLEEGDILLEKSGGGDQQPVGRVVMYADPEPAITSNFVTRLRPNKSRVQTQYLLYTLDNLQRGRVINPAIKQTTGIQNLDERAYLGYRIPVPPIEEQQSISEHLYHVDELVSQQNWRMEREIELMQEYRTRLISDVITGKVRIA